MARRLALIVAVLVVAGGIGLASPSRALAATDPSCAAFSSIGGVAAGTGATNGYVGTFSQGDVITITASLGTATSATFTIVGSFTGSPVLAGPGNAPGTLTYTVPSALPAGSIGIGYFIVSANGTVNITASCASGGTSGIPGPPIPSGFVLHTITCTVAVFDQPGGHPVGSNQITAGQTWFVNPKPVKDSSGKSWTEIFVGGYIDGFIPTSCVH